MRRFYFRRMRHGLVPLLAVAFALLAGCGRSLFEGYKEVANDVHIKLRVLGDEDRVPRDSDSVFVRVRVARIGEAPGSLFSTERWYAHMDAVLPAGIPVLNEGDSLGVIARGRLIPWTSLGAAAHPTAVDTSWVAMEVSLRALRSPAESRRLALVRARSRTAIDEKTALDKYLADTSVHWKEFMGVHYQLGAKNQNGPVIRSGELVTVHYQAHSLVDGRLLDDTRRAGQPLTFRLGDPGQVIKGIEIALHVLPHGGRGRFIFPSALAFGAEGSSSGIVPPYTPVLYEIEAVEASGAEAIAVDSAI